MSFWNKWLFGRGKDIVRDGPAHSSDRHGFWKDLWKLRLFLGIEPEHSGSVDIYDHFGALTYNDNDVKRERRDRWRPALTAIMLASQDDELQGQIRVLLVAFDQADAAKGWRG